MHRLLFPNWSTLVPKSVLLVLMHKNKVPVRDTHQNDSTGNRTPIFRATTWCTNRYATEPEDASQWLAYKKYSLTVRGGNRTHCLSYHCQMTTCSSPGTLGSRTQAQIPVSIPPRTYTVGGVGLEPTVFLCHGFTDRFLRRSDTHRYVSEWISETERTQILFL